MQYTTLIVELFKKILIAGDLDVSNTLPNATKTLVVIAQTEGPTGGAAGRQGAQDGPRWLQEGLRELKMASKIAQDSSKWRKIASNIHPRGHKTAP